MTPIEALIRLLAESAQMAHMGQHSYIVGGAPRDYVLGLEVKDIDVVVEPQNGRDAQTLGNEIASRLGLKCHADQYGVVHIGPVGPRILYDGVSLEGLKVEVVTSRKEKYDRSRKKDSHKPSEVAVGTILEDLQRRDFTINTLMWQLGDLMNGPEGAPIIDHLGGLDDIAAKRLRTPLNPYETFDDDPSRMLRAVRFSVKLNFAIDDAVYRALKDKAAEILRLPYEAIDPLLFDKILTMDSEKVRAALMVMDHAGLLPHVLKLIPEARQRRAIQERVKDPRTLIRLANWRFNVGINFSGKQLSHLLVAAASLNDAELEALFRRFKTPIDTEEFIKASGAQGAAIGKAVERGRDLVLMGLSPERVMELVIEGHNP